MCTKQQLFDFIKQNPNSSFLDIAKYFKIKPFENRLLTNILFELVDEYKVVKNSDNSYTGIEKIKTIEGEIRLASEGKYAFVDVVDEENNLENKESYFIPGLFINQAMNNDIVKINVFKYNDVNQSKTFAMVDKIIQRKTNKIVGILVQHKNFVVFRTIKKDYKKLNFFIKDIVSEARLNDVVLAEIVEFKKDKVIINIIRKIASIDDPMCYVKALTVEKNVPENFPEQVINEANLIPSTIEYENKDNRVDFRNELIVTIDGDDTKDFDDAIVVKKLEDGNYELGVHIADVSYYVKENSDIDNEALNRGTSIYLVNEVIPMLPKVLSNGICSLNPNEDRFTMSIIMKINDKGETIESKIVPGIICSKYRLTYNRVNQFIENNEKFEDNNLNIMLNNAVELAKLIRARKNEEGYIDFEIQEPKIILDQTGKTVDIKIDESGFSQALIEDFMVRANEQVAKYLTDRKIPMLYRIHDKPDEEKINNFLNVLNSVDIHVKIDKNNITPKTFQSVVQKIKEQRNDDFLKMLFLRTMQKACYSPNNIGHFGLASVDYCHFTSPIRRYPDLVVHRIIRDVIFEKNKKNIQHYNEILPVFAERNSQTEQNAMQIERDTNDLKYAEFYVNKIGTIMRGQIISVLKFGMFVQFDNKTEALIHISTMTDDEYKLNEIGTKLVGSKNSYKLGDYVNVVIVDADMSTGKVDAVLENLYDKYLNDLQNKTFRYDSKNKKIKGNNGKQRNKKFS
ncbi:ribonuclease R [Mycoplasmopsis lipofaciens]|uniref:ribonuclease R n=1 Tax=Mycoplasmopsis lipofaciens TaxID=114884 RepID=UPI000488E0E9|nr:ribonuclease R [Mycoplasmopsis lipofaciens]